MWKLITSKVYLKVIAIKAFFRPEKFQILSCLERSLVNLVLIIAVFIVNHSDIFIIFVAQHTNASPFKTILRTYEIFGLPGLINLHQNISRAFATYFLDKLFTAV